VYISEPVGAGEEATYFHGEKAMERLFETVADKEKSGGKITCGDLSVLHGYSWLLNDVQRDLLNAWAKRVLGPADAGFSAATEASSSTKGMAKPGAQQATTRVTSMVASLFKA